MRGLCKSDCSRNANTFRTTSVAMANVHCVSTSSPFALLVYLQYSLKRRRPCDLEMFSRRVGYSDVGRTNKKLLSYLDDVPVGRDAGHALGHVRTMRAE